MRSIIIGLCFVTSMLFGQAGQLVELKRLDSSLVLDIRYATDNNFLHRPLYKQARCFLVGEAAEKLLAVQRELRSIGLGLKIFDGYRPLAVQKAMWAILPDPRYVADPAKGSRHNRGCAVDVTLVDEQGRELAMPTPYDTFSPKAHHSYQQLPAEVRRHRWILKTVMEKHGFKPISSEWWHYDLVGWQNYPILDLSFEQIDSLQHGEK